MSKKGGLRLVPYSPEDYSIADVLGENDGTILKSSEQVSACLSLYFQWEEYRRTRIYASNPSSSPALHCEMDYDRDERVPTEIWIRLTAPESAQEFEEFRGVYVRFEVFRTCYEFQANVTARFSEPGASIQLVLSVPKELKVYKSRRLPRTLVDESLRAKLPEVTWRSSPSESPIVLDVTEIGLRSIRVATSAPLSGSEGILQFGETTFSALIVKNDADGSIIAPELETPDSFGKFFDLYRRIVYPYLKSRYEIPFDKGIRLYEESNYFGKFSKGDVDEAKRELPSLWEDIQSGFHETTADYYIVDDEGNPTGASSLALGFYSDDHPIWVFHQTCALKKPELITRSGALYLWRAEYLAGRPGELRATVSFDSKSRWLERIYVKFSARNEQHTCLHPTRTMRATFQIQPIATPKELQVKKTKYKIGRCERVSTESPSQWAGANPRFLSATEGLNEIISIWNSPKDDDLILAANRIAREIDTPEITLRLIVPINHKFAKITGTDLVSDRVCTFEKNSLTELLNSIDHSVAVTKRKVADGAP